MWPIHHQITLFKSLLFSFCLFQQVINYFVADILHCILISHQRSDRFGAWCVYLFSIFVQQTTIQLVSGSNVCLFFPGFCEVGIQTLCREPRDHERCESRSKARLSSHPEIQMKRDLLLNSPKFLVDLDSISEKSVLSGIKNSRWFVFTFKASNRKSKSGFFTRQSVI